MAFLTFPYFWCIRVSPIQRLPIKFEYFLTFKVDSTLKIQNLKSEFTLTIILTVSFYIYLTIRRISRSTSNDQCKKGSSQNSFKICLNLLYRKAINI